MPWSLNKNGVTPGIPLQPSEQLNLNTFMNAVRAGVHPRQAASSWDSKYTEFKGQAVRQGEIRLGGKNRAAFFIDDATQVVTMTAVGGHS